MSELDHMDALAAEYVLGTLESEERAQARTLLDADQAFAAKVQLWERRFGELHLMVEPVEPDSSIWARIKTQMPEGRQQIRPPEPPISPAPAPAAAGAASEPPSLDAIEAAISEAATTLSAEANASGATPTSQAPTSETVPTSVSEATATPASEAMPTSVAEATSAPASEPTPTSLSEPAALAASEATSAPISEAPAATPGATETSAVEAVPSPPVAPVSAGVTPQPAQDLETEAVTAATGTSAVEAVPSPPVAPASAAVARRPTRDEDLERATAVLRRRLTRWRALAILMTLLVAGAAVLLAAWRFTPDRVPPMLQPLEVMRHLGVTFPVGSPPRRPAPPGSQFDE
jgi:hypothetical protein